MMRNREISNDIRKNSALTYNTTSSKAKINESDFGDTYPAWMFWKKRRYVVAVMAFFGFFNVYSLRVNLSIAIVAMTENRTVTHDNGTVTYEQYFDWDSKVQGLLLSSFFYGYIFTQLPGGWLASRIGGHKVFGIGILATSLLTLITPPLANVNVYVLIAVRIIEGLFEGVTFPCIHGVWSRWAPPMERSRLATLAFSGSYAGTVVSMPVCGLLAAYVGWESIFYIFGTIGVLWFCAWWIIVKEGPELDPYISQSELLYIQSSLGTGGRKDITHPWKKIFLSSAVWAIIASHFSENWGFYTLLTQLPTFMKDTLKFELEKTGFMSAIPYLAMGIMLQFSGQLADWCQVKGYLTTTQVRRYFNCSAFIAQTVFMLGAAFLLQPIGSVVCLTFAVGLGAFAWSGFSVNHLDIAPQHASVLMGISNTFGTLPGIISPMLTGYIVQTKSSSEWQTVFYITSGIYLVGAVIYWFYASGERQPWAKEPEELSIAQINEKTGKHCYSNEAVEVDTF